MIPVCEPLLDGNEEKYVLDALRTNWISSSGRYITEIEQKMSAYCGQKFGVAASSGTTALHLACLALGIGPGDEVIIPDFTLIVSANVVLWTGARPVLADVDSSTWCIDPKQIEAKITKKTKAIMAVHMYGHPCDMDSIMNIAKKNNLYVIEDCAESHGATYKGAQAGSFGDAACFSFYGNKIITSGEGGLLAVRDPAIAERAKLFRNQAFEEPRFVHKQIGYNYRLTNIQAAIALAQFERIDQKVARKREIASEYNRLLSSCDDLELPIEAPNCRNVYWMYGVLLGDSFPSKDEVMKTLLKNGVETRSFFCPMSMQPVFKSDRPEFPDVSGKYPVSHKLFQRGFYLPSGLGLTDVQIKEVAQKLRACRKSALTSK